jgi:glycosyltransferase involved in cell wall biosynthesis
MNQEFERSASAGPPGYEAFLREKRGELLRLRGEVLNRSAFEVVLEAARRFEVGPAKAYGDLAPLPQEGALPRRVRMLSSLLRVNLWTCLLTDHMRAAAARLLRLRRTVPTRARGRATIVILSYRRPRALRRTLRSLRATTDADTTEIIVVDNGSTEATQRLIEQALASGVISAAVLCKENIGISAGYNLGFSLASPDSAFLTKIDHDQVVLTPGWLACVTALLSDHPEVGVVALDQVNHPKLQELPVGVLDGLPVKSWWSWVCGSTMTMSRHVRERVVGDFLETDVNYFPDDADYGFRAQVAGLSPSYLVGHCSYHIPKLRWRLTRRARGEAEQVAHWQQMLERLFEEYVLGRRSIFIKYDRYGALRFPTQRRLLVLDESFTREIISAGSGWRERAATSR